MNIIVMGCGKIGSALAAKLNNEGHNITLIDRQEQVVKELATSLDVMGVTGNGAMIDVLREAGIADTDILIAATDSDEINMLSCLIAKKEGNCQTIARIRNPEYEVEVNYLKHELDLAMVVNPEKMVAMEIVRLLNIPAALAVESFSKGRVEMITLRLSEESSIVNMALKDLNRVTDADVLICMVVRNQEVIIPTGETVLMAGDTISFIAPPATAVQFCRLCAVDHKFAKSVVVAGASKITYYLVKILERTRKRMNIKVIEKDHEKCVELANEFPAITVIEGDASNRQLLLEEGVREYDAFVALTGMDEQNVILSMVIGAMGVPHCMTKLNHLDTDLLYEEHIPVGSVIAPKNVTTDEIVRFVRGLERSSGANMETLYMIADGKAEAAEFVVDDDPLLVNIPLFNLNLKPNVLVASIVRKNKPIRPTGQDVLMPKDRVVIITSNRGLSDLRDILA